MRGAVAMSAVLVLMVATPVQAGGVTHRHEPGEKRVMRDGGPKSQRSDFVTKLSEDNVRTFIADIQRVVSAGSGGAAADEVANWFNNHIADKARFDSVMQYEMPGYAAQESTMSLGKEEYINGVLSAGAAMSDYKQDVQIVDIKISGGGRSAKVKTRITETGQMPWPKDEPAPDGRVGDMVPMPVKGVADCEQTIGISINNFIQMQKAECRTVMSFDPFEAQELGDDMMIGR